MLNPQSLNAIQNERITNSTNQPEKKLINNYELDQI